MSSRPYPRPPVSLLVPLLAAAVLIPAAVAAQQQTESTGRVAAKLAELGIELPEMPAPIANYVRTRRVGSLVYLSGHGPLLPDGGYVTGKLGKDLTVDEGYRAARLTAIALLASLEGEIGDLDRVRQVVKVVGMVNATPEFTQHPQVINGCSDLLVELFGDAGRHVRAAVGMASLPLGIAVEIEMIVEVE